MSNKAHPHWDQIYATKAEATLGWTESVPDTSLALIRALDLPQAARIVDVGAGLSDLMLALLGDGFSRLTCLDLSGEALARARARLGALGETVDWVQADVTTWHPDQVFDLWHDRAVFHFLTQEAGQQAYIETMARAIRPGGHAVIATFAEDGPERCAGLPVHRWAPDALSARLGARFVRLRTIRHGHETPRGALQRYPYSLFQYR